MKAACVLVCLTLAHGITASIFRQQERGVDGLDVQQLEYTDQYQQLLRDQPTADQKQRDQTLQAQKNRSKQLKNQNQKIQRQFVEDETYYQDKKQEKLTQVPTTQYQQKQPSYIEQNRKSPSSNSQEWPSTNEAKYSHDKKHQSPSSNSQEWPSTNEAKYSHDKKHQSPSSNSQEWPSTNEAKYSHGKKHQSPSSNSQEWPSTNEAKYSHHKNRHNKNHGHSSSSSESSQESQEKLYYGNKPSIIDGNYQKWIESLIKSVMVNKDNLNTQVSGNTVEWNGLRMTVGPKSPVQTPEDIEEIFGDALKAMRHIEEDEKVKFHEVYDDAQKEAHKLVLLNSTQMAQKNQYPIEEHTIKTDDGYILTVFRIPPKKEMQNVQKKPVFLMHGLLGSSDDWLLMGPGKSLAYMLSDAGYDVWLGNARGNKYSSHHVTKSPALPGFWEFSTDEIALLDVPAMIDLVLEKTKQEKLYYIGHAMGTTVCFGLTATRPEYNDKIVMMHALSPMVYMTNVRSPLIRMLSPIGKLQDQISREIGNKAFTPSKELTRLIGGAMLENEVGCKKISSNVEFVLAGVNVDGMDPNIMPVVMSHLPAGTSAKVIKQYGQEVASQEFRRYDYGPYMNAQVYGTPEPPKFNISEIQTPVSLYYSKEDWLAHPKDVERLQKELPNVIETYLVPEEHFSHLDFQFSSKAPELVYKRIIESMQNRDLL